MPAAAAVVPRRLNLMLQRCRIGQGRKRLLGRDHRFTRCFKHWLKVGLALCKVCALRLDPFERRGRGSIARAASRASRSAASAAWRACLGGLAALLHRGKRAVAFGQRGVDSFLQGRYFRARAAARRLARISRSAAAAPEPFATKPSQRRSRPSR